MTTQGMSIHAVDTTTGRPMVGMRVQVYAVSDGRTLLADAEVSPRGLVDHPRLAERLVPGHYEVCFYVADFYRSVGTALPERPFLGVARYRFGIADAGRHYHLPFKTTPWGFACFLGA